MSRLWQLQLEKEIRLGFALLRKLKTSDRDVTRFHFLFFFFHLTFSKKIHFAAFKVRSIFDQRIKTKIEKKKFYEKLKKCAKQFWARVLWSAICATVWQPWKTETRFWKHFSRTWCKVKLQKDTLLTSSLIWQSYQTNAPIF